MLNQILIPFQNQWVALTRDRKKIVASASNVKQLADKLNKLKNNDAIMMHVLPMKGSYSP